jgi:hypothetical protein
MRVRGRNIGDLFCLLPQLFDANPEAGEHFCGEGFLQLTSDALVR